MEKTENHTNLPLRINFQKSLMRLSTIGMLSFALVAAPSSSYLYAQSEKKVQKASKASTAKKNLLKRRSKRYTTLKKGKAKTSRRKFINKRKKPIVRKKKTKAKPKPKLVKAENSKQGRATIDTFRNKVSVQDSRTGIWKKGKKGDKVNAYDRVKTGRRSMARLELQDGSKILLLSNSQAELSNLSTVDKTIKLLRGKVRAIVRRLKSARTFRIETPIGVASVRGTEFEVSYEEDKQDMMVEVLKGRVGVSKLGDLSDEILLNPGDKIRFGIEGELGDPIQTGSIPLNRRDVKHEVQITRVKDSVVALAAQELKSADYQTNKSLIDVDGTRIRVEEYITRPASNQFKLVALNHRPARFDYFTYLGTFNKDLPTDLSVALGQVGGKLGSTAPEYYLTAYESFMSNTKDSIRDVGTGGHLVRIDFDGTNYTLTDSADGSNTRTISAAVLQGDGSYKIYNPIKDTFSLVTASNLTEALKISILDAGSYRNLTSGDIFWKTRFNSNTFSINNTVKTSFAQKTTANTLAISLDANWTNPAISTISEFPSGANQLHNKLSLFYQDGSKLVYDNYIIDDEGNIAGTDAFSGISTSADYQNTLVNYNYQQKVTSDEMEGRSINLVIDPRIGTMSGLIQ